MAGIDFESIKEKVTETASAIADKSADVAKKVAGKASEFGKKAKLNAELVAEKEALKKKYQEMGRLYYEKYSNSLDPDFAQTESDIKLSLEKIAAKQAELDELKAASAPEEAEDADFDDVLDDEESDEGGVEIEITVEEEPDAPEAPAAPEAEEEEKKDE